MSIERPTFNYDNQGNSLVPAEADNLPADPAHTTALINATEDARSPVESSAPVPTKGRGWSGNPDWDKPRNQAGQFITKSENELRQTWDAEGGYAVNATRVMQAEQSILSMSDNPGALQTAFNELPQSIQLKAADVMRLSAGYKDGGAGKWLQFEDSLTPSELATFKTWWRKLPQSDRDAIELVVAK